MSLIKCTKAQAIDRYVVISDDRPVAVMWQVVSFLQGAPTFSAQRFGSAQTKSFMKARYRFATEPEIAEAVAARIAGYDSMAEHRILKMFVELDPMGFSRQI